MAFWGVELRPGIPYTHCYNPSHGRLRICQATLGSCDAATRTMVQCIVGNKTPIILCSLNPRLAEMCHLEIELEEDDEVIFSVIGQSTVHLSGYYLSTGSRRNVQEDGSESVGDSDDNDGEYNGSEDSYESDFIDDGHAAVPEDNYASGSLDDGNVGATPDCHKKDGNHSNSIRTLEDGLVIEDLLARGDQDSKVASYGSKVYVKCVCKPKDGKIVAYNAEEEKIYKFKLGAGNAIHWLDRAINGMRVGNKRRLTVPPSMRSGSKVVGIVAENSTIFEVELLKVG